MTPFDDPDGEPLKPPKFHTYKVQLPSGLTIEKPIYLEKQLLSASEVQSAMFAIRLDGVIEREQAICLIWGELLVAGFKGPAVRNLAGLLWMAGRCFDRSLDALAKHHRLGVWKLKRLA